MKIKGSNYIIWFVVSLLSVIGIASLAKQSTFRQLRWAERGDTLRKDTSNKDVKYKPSRKPNFKAEDRNGNSFTDKSSPALLPPPSNIKTDVSLDTGNNYIITEKVGDYDYRAPSTMTFDEYSKYQQQKYLRNYWRGKSQGQDGESAVTGRSLIPKIYISPVFDRIFGGNYVDIKPNGFVSLDFGVRAQRVNNPAFTIRQQRTPPNFEFDQQISMNVTGKIGEKATITANFDTKSSFQYENNIKFEYTGFEEDIIKKIEVGNVSLPLNNSLIQGAQNLFGIKTQLQFGKLFVTALASTQRGTREEVKISGGSQRKNFELRADNYEDNKHFFLSHYFRENYEPALKSLPNPTSRVIIPLNRVEVYIVNRTNNTNALRNIIGLADLGESNATNIGANRNGLNTVNVNLPNSPADNAANDLYSKVTNSGRLGSDQITDYLTTLGLQQGQDFEKITSARKLTDRDFTINPALGYISLNTPLKTDEALAVAYQYTAQGRPYKVGELTEDYQNRPQNEVIVLKLLRPNSIRTTSPMWSLMMKNIYSLGASSINRDNFQLRIVYRDDNTGLDNPNLHEGTRTKDIPLVQIFNMDQLNPNNDPQPDGNFDYIEGITIDSKNGRVVFPVLEPFGSHLNGYFTNSEQSLKDKYVFQELYAKTKADAAQTAGKNKFFIVGSYEGQANQGVSLNAIGIAQGSVRVTQGNNVLVENVDYQVDYNTGQVSFLKDQYNQTGSDIKISYEKDELFTPVSKTLLGTRLDYRVNKNFNIGGTMLYLNERPLITRLSVGDEPVRNMLWGTDVNYSKDSRVLTRLVDRLPFIRTKEVSNIALSGEFAQLVPGTSNKNGGKGIAYIDDFEGSKTSYDLGRLSSLWKIGSTPLMFNPLNIKRNDLSVGYQRAKLAWYTVDQTVFYRTSGNNKPDNIGEKDTQKDYFTRAIQYNEIFKNRDPQTINLPEATFDLAYFPDQRGPYNYNPNLTADGKLSNPKNNWAAITRNITSEIDFDNINVEYIEFWLMDPFLKGDNANIIISDSLTYPNSEQDGKLIFNLGNISEDVLPDHKHMFENGLPTNGDLTNGEDTTIWGHTPTRQYLNNAFEQGKEARAKQDVGLDGLNNGEEATFFAKSFLDNVRPKLTPEAMARIEKDPSADDFEYFLGGDQDQNKRKIIGRYLNYNGMEGNSPDVSNTSGSFTPVGTNLPDNEDLNKDNTINELDAYYQYEIELSRNTLNLNNKYIADNVKDDKNVNWYLFRIPIRDQTSSTGNIDNYKTMRFIRTILTGFEKPIVLRFLNFQLVSTQWRKFPDYKDYAKLADPDVHMTQNNLNPSFVVSTVSMEENGPAKDAKAQDPNRTSYIEPPGFRRDIDNSSLRNRRLNEQSLRLCVDNLLEDEGRAAFKYVNFDFINYKRLKMFIHAQSNDPNTKDGQVRAFIRLGTDFFENFYEIELPLSLSKIGASTPTDVWLEENNVDIAFSDLTRIKVNRNSKQIDRSTPYYEMVDKYRITIVGNPDYSSVQIAMLGIRNPKSPEDNSAKSICIWTNELRVTDFDNTAGWAVTGRINMKLADFATISASGRHSTYGFGGLQDRISERSRQETSQYFVSSNISLDKFFPKKLGLKIPMFVSYENEVKKPRFDPLDKDVPLSESITKFSNKDDQNTYLALVQDRRVRRSLNFTNVGKIRTNPNAKAHLWDIENLAFTYAYSDEKRSSENIESYLSKTYKLGVGYTYSNTPKYFEPFKKFKFLGSPFLKLLKDFNIGLGPSTITIRGDLDRRFARTNYRTFPIGTPNLITPNYLKAFTFTRNYDLRYNISKNLAFDYTATAYAIIDEPAGEIDTKQNQDSVLVNIKKLGRMKNFTQTTALTYKLPLDKFPLTDWVDAQAKYSACFNWAAGAIRPRKDTLGQADTLGNIMSNNRKIELIGKINLTTLYNKNKFLKELSTAKPPAQQSKNPSKPLPPNQPGDKKDSIQKAPPRQLKFLKEIFKVLLTAKSIDVNYSITDQTTMPGFMPTPKYFGMSEGFTAPGWDFILGSQNPGIKDRMAKNGWLAPSTFQSNPFQQVRTTQLSLRTQLEPIKDFKIQLDAKRQTSDNYQEIFRYGKNPLSSDYLGPLAAAGYNPNRNGNFSISIVSIKTAFDKEDNQHRSGAFKNFTRYRNIIHSRITGANHNPEQGTYDLNSQDVLIPAFYAAYTGQDVTKIKLSPFPKIPMPNWRIDYTGLGKIDGLKDVFSSIVLNHQYVSNLTIGNFVSAYNYTNVPSLNSGLNYPFAYVKDAATGRWVPFFVINDITIDEQFSPLVGFNFRTKKRLTGKIDYKTSRAVGLNLSNHQVNEQNRKEIAVSIGFTTNNFKVPFKIEGKTVVLKNDLNFRCDLSVSDTRTIQRILSDSTKTQQGLDLNTITQGNLNIQFRPNISYVLNQKLQIQIYFERGINNPKVSNSYKRTTTAGGAQLRFSLSQ